MVVTGDGHVYRGGFRGVHCPDSFVSVQATP